MIPGNFTFFLSISCIIYTVIDSINKLSCIKQMESSVETMDESMDGSNGFSDEISSLFLHLTRFSSSESQSSSELLAFASRLSSSL